MDGGFIENFSVRNASKREPFDVQVFGKYYLPSPACLSPEFAMISRWNSQKIVTFYWKVSSKNLWKALQRIHFRSDDHRLFIDHSGVLPIRLFARFRKKKILKSKAFEHQCLRVWDSWLRNAKLLAWIFLSVNTARHDLINRGTGALKTSNMV